MLSRQRRDGKEEICIKKVEKLKMKKQKRYWKSIA
jgi:hypothetical protein